MSDVAKFEKVPCELSGEVLVHRLCETIVVQVPSLYLIMCLKMACRQLCHVLSERILFLTEAGSWRAAKQNA